MGEPIRVAQIMGKMVGGGLEAVVMNYYRHIDRSHIQFDFIVDSDSTLVPRDEVDELGGRVFTVPPYQHIVSYQRALIGLFREQGWKIVHSHENALSVFPLHAAKIAGVPVRIAHSHSTSGKGEMVRNALKWALRRFANVYPTHRMACSRHAGEWLFGKKSDFTLLYNAIDLSSFWFDPSIRNEVRTELGIPSGSLVIGHVGRFVTQKNQSFLLDSFSSLISNGIDSTLILVGDGPMRGEIREKAINLGLAERVLFPGQRDDVERLYQAFDVFCLPSLYEGLGIVSVEAQAAGLPCILSDRIPREVQVTGSVRFLPIEDASLWTDSMCGLSPGERMEVRPECFADYDIESAAGKLATYYSSLIGRSYNDGH